VIRNSDWVETLDPAQVAMAALCEAGRHDLAERVVPNRAGWPGLHPTDPADRPLIVRAFLLGHRSRHPGAFIDAGGGITCYDCYPELIPPGLVRHDRH
jgi:hypothetical protein